MERIFIDELTDIADIMYENICEGCEDIAFLGLYEDAAIVVKELLANYDDTSAYVLSIDPDYDKEYIITLDSDMNVYCEKAYLKEYNKYVHFISECILVADDCGSEALKNAKAKNIYVVSYELDNEECDMIASSKHESEHISRTKDGKVAGFTKSWSNTDANGIHYYSSYSHYGNNEDAVKRLAKEFGINI